MNSPRPIGASLLIGAAFGLLAAVGVTSAQQVEPAHFHHTRINTTDAEQSLKFYQRVFGATSIRYRGGPEVLLVDRAFLLFNEVETHPPWELESGLYHIGWGCRDADAEQAWLRKHNVEIETPATQFGPFKFLYAFGPSRELFEFYSGIPKPQFCHVHLIASDVAATARWYMTYLGLSGPPKMPPRPPAPPEEFQVDRDNPIAAMRYLWATEVRTADDVRINIFHRPSHDNFNWWIHNDHPPQVLKPSKGRALDHIAFSVTDLTAVRDRMRAGGVKIERDIALDDDYGYESFSVTGPDKVTIEIVKEKPIPEGIWQ